MAMFTTYLALVAIQHGAPYWLAFVIALCAGFVLGVVVERVLVRPVESRPPLNAVILTLGVLILLEAVAPMLFGGSTQSFPVPVSNIDIVVGSTDLNASPFALFTPCQPRITLFDYQIRRAEATITRIIGHIGDVRGAG